MLRAKTNLKQSLWVVIITTLILLALTTMFFQYHVEQIDHELQNIRKYEYK